MTNRLFSGCLILGVATGPLQLRAQQVTPAATADTADAKVVEWVRAHVRPLSEDPGSSADLEPLTTVIGDARVIGLGEADHGVHEFFAFRNRFLRFAVESLGVTAIAVESGYTESNAVDDYVLGRDDLTPAIVSSVFSWSSDVAYADNRALLEWIRHYNAQPTTKRKVHFYGIDLTGGRDGSFVGAHRSIDSALSYVAVVDPTQERTLRRRLEPLNGHFASGLYDSLTVAQQDALTATLDDLIALFERRSATWPVATTQDMFNRAFRSAIVARQLNANFRAAAAESNPQAQRESSMAENLLWVLQQVGRRERVLLYEANWHISKGPMASDRWGTSLGEYLHSMLGTDYVAVATSYGEKSEPRAGATTEVTRADPTSVAASVSRVCLSICWLPLRVLPENGPVAQWFHKMRPIQGGRVDQVIVDKAFDGVVFIKAVHFATFGACTSGSIARPWDATRRACGGADTTSTTSAERRRCHGCLCPDRRGWALRRHSSARGP
jgi:erythromycin esterase